jgi:hypothetical protein
MSIGSQSQRGGDGSGQVPRGFGIGRGAGAESFAQRREAAQRRLLSSARQVELVDSAVRALDEQLADYRVADPDGTLHATARALLAVAYGAEAYDVAFAPAHGRVAIRVRRSDFGLEATIVDLAADDLGRGAHPRDPDDVPPRLG